MQGKEASVCSFEAFLTICTRGKIGELGNWGKIGEFYSTKAPFKVNEADKVLELATPPQARIDNHENIRFVRQSAI